MSKRYKNNSENLSLVRYEDFWGYDCPFSLKKGQCFINNGTNNYFMETKPESTKYNEDIL